MWSLSSRGALQPADISTKNGKSVSDIIKRNRVVFEFFRTYQLFEHRIRWVTNLSLRFPGQLSPLNFFAGKSTHVLADGLYY